MHDEDAQLDAAWRRQIDICRHSGIAVVGHGIDTSMDWLWLSAGEGAPWRRMSLDDYAHDDTRWVPGDTLYANDTGMLAALAEVRDRCAPRAWLYVGPTPQIWGYHWPLVPRERPDGTVFDAGAVRYFADFKGFCADRKASIGIGLCGGVPLRTMHHEVLHHVWRRLDWDEQAALEKYGDALRDAGAPPDVRDHGWWAKAEEAEARSYEMWSCGLPQPHDAEPPADVIQVWRRIASGVVGRR